jgi:hypothetical protein
MSSHGSYLLTASCIPNLRSTKKTTVVINSEITENMYHSKATIPDQLLLILPLKKLNDIRHKMGIAYLDFTEISANC